EAPPHSAPARAAAEVRQGPLGRVVEERVAAEEPAPGLLQAWPSAEPAVPARAEVGAGAEPQRAWPAPSRPPRLWPSRQPSPWPLRRPSTWRQRRLWLWHPRRRAPWLQGRPWLSLRH